MPENGLVLCRDFCLMGLILLKVGEVLYGVIWEGLGDFGTRWHLCT